MSRWRAPCAVMCAAVAAAVLVTPDASPAAAASCGVHHGNWRTTAAPAGLATFSHAGADTGATYLAVDPLDPNHMYVSPDKTRVLRSLDGGCTWTTVFDLSALANEQPDSLYTPTASQYRIYQIVVPHGRAASDGRTVYALADIPDGVAYGLPMLLAVSTDGGSTWRVPSPPGSAAMPFGAPECSGNAPAWLAPAPGHPGTMYFFCPQGGANDLSAVPPVTNEYNVLYRTTDGGNTWSVRSVNKVSLDSNGGLGSLLDVDSRNPATLYAVQPGYEPATKTLLTQFYVSTDGGASFQKQFGGSGWDPDYVDFTALTAANGPARLATFGQKAGLCVSEDAGRHGSCWKPPVRNGWPGMVSGTVWSANGDKLFVTVAYSEDWQFTGCGLQHAGVLTVKHLRWHDLGVIPPTAPGAAGVAITNLVADSHGDVPTMIAQPCAPKQGTSDEWTPSSAPAVLLHYTAAW